MNIRNVVIVREADMSASELYTDMVGVSDRRLKNALAAIESVVNERAEYEANRERKIGGIITVGQSPDIRHAEALINNEAFARMVLALKIDLRSYIFPQSQENGKSDSETSNLKSYRKVRQIAETVLHGSSDLEGVARVFSVCVFHFARNGNGLLNREYCKAFLSSREFANLDTGTAQLFADVDDIRAKQMSGGAETQSGQMVRSLVALKSATDVRDGRNKNVAIDQDGKVLRALMVRLGQIRPESETETVTA